MKRQLLCICLVFSALSATYAQNCLDFAWQINRGDSAQWQSANFVPHNWKKVNIGVSLERQGYGCYSGYYSLWNEVVIPSKYKNDQNLQLSFRFDSEKADVFFNGKAVGASKQRGSEEQFELPSRLVRWDKPNYILVRLYNSFYTGGACNSYIHIKPVLPGNSKNNLIVTALFKNEQHIYPDPSNIPFTTSIVSNEGQNIVGVQKAVIINDFHDTVLTLRTNIMTNTGKQENSYTLGCMPPGFYQMQLSFSSDGVEAQHISWFAVAPEKIIAKPVNQQQAGVFWTEAKKELASISPQFKLTKVDTLCTRQNNVYIVEMKSLGNITVRGWYIVPARAGVYPAVLHLQGYSVAMRPQWFMNDTDMIHLALDVRGHGLSADVINPGFNTPGYVGYQVGDPEQYIYRGAYMDCSRAIDFLLSRSEVDSSRLAVEGHSQGGGMSLATAALNAGKVKYCVTGSPFLSDFAHHVQIRTIYGDEMAYYMKHNHVSKEKVYETMNLVDNVNLAGLIQCPVLMGAGLFDDDCPPHINFAAYNNIKASKEYYILPHSAHLLGEEWQLYSRAWLRKMFRLY